MRAILASVGGTNLEGTSGYAQSMYNESLRVPSPQEVEAFRRGGDELPVMISEIHGPRLLAFAIQAGALGLRLVNEYIALQARNQYQVYRDLSLYKLVPSIVRHPSDAATLALLLEIANAALSGREIEFAEPAWLALLVLRSREQGGSEFNGLLVDMDRAASNLQPGHERGDLWGDHRRRFAAAAEATSQLLQSDAKHLLDRACALPRGYSGIETYTRLTLAESLLICGAPAASIQEQLYEARASAENIQDACYCARSVARTDTLLAGYWNALLAGQQLDVENEVRQLERGEAVATWSVEHRVGRTYPLRSSDNYSLALPDWMLSAQTPDMIASVYEVTAEELLGINPGLTSGDTLPLQTLVRAPDHGFRPLLAAFFSAVALSAPGLTDKKRVNLIQRLVVPTLDNPTALQTVLGRLVLAAERAKVPLSPELEGVAKRYVRSGAVLRGPAGRALISEHLR